MSASSVNASVDKANPCNPAQRTVRYAFVDSVDENSLLKMQRDGINYKIIGITNECSVVTSTLTCFDIVEIYCRMASNYAQRGNRSWEIAAFWKQRLFVWHYSSARKLRTLTDGNCTVERIARCINPGALAKWYAALKTWPRYRPKLREQRPREGERCQVDPDWNFLGCRAHLRAIVCIISKKLI